MGAAGVMGAGTGLGLVGDVMSAEAERENARYKANQMFINADFADLKAKQALQAGDQEASRYSAKGRQTVGAQRAALAAQGIDVNIGSAIDVQEETKRIIETDVNQIRTNAIREAWGYKTEASNLRAQAGFTRAASEAGYVGSLISGGARAIKGGAETYSTFRNESKGTR